MANCITTFFISYYSCCCCLFCIELYSTEYLPWRERQARKLYAETHYQSPYIYDLETIYENEGNAQ